MADDLDDTTDADTDLDDASGADTSDDADTSGADDSTKDATDGKPAAKPRAPKIEGDFDKDRYERTMARIRGEAAAAKEAKAAAEKEKADLLRAVQRALGGGEDDKPDPEALTRQLEEARTAEKQRRTENLVLRLAPAAGADPDILLDSTSFLRDLAKLDPEARDDVEDLVRDYAKKHPRYRLAAAAGEGGGGEDGTTGTDKKAEKKPAGKSGADMNGAAAKPRQVTAAELAKMTPQEIVTAQEKGLLDSLLAGA